MSTEVALGIGSAIAGIAGHAMNVAATNNLNASNRIWQEKMWTKSNEYNTPLEQKRRLEEAGINPFAVLSQGGADTGQAGSAGTPNTFQQHQIDGAGLFGAAVQAAMNKKLMQRQDLENENLGIQNQFARDREIVSLMEQKANIEKLRMEADKNSSDKKLLDLEYDSLNSRLQSLVTQSESEARILSMVADNKQRELDDAHNESIIRQKLAAANIRLNDQQIMNLVRQVGEIDAHINLLVKQGKLTEQEAINAKERQYTEVANRALERSYYRLAAERTQHDLYNTNQPNDVDDSSLTGGIVGSIVTTLLSRGMGSSTVVRGFRR